LREKEDFPFLLRNLLIAVGVTQGGKPKKPKVGHSSLASPIKLPVSVQTTAGATVPGIPRQRKKKILLDRNSFFNQ